MDISSEDIPQNALALHGTSTKAFEIARKTGILPPTHQKALKGDLYFAPVTENFSRSSYAIKLAGEYSHEEAVDTVGFYAQLGSWEHFLIDELGTLPSWFFEVAHTRDNLIQLLVGEKPFLSKRNAISLLDRMFALRGVVLVPSENLFSLPYYPGDDPSYIAVHCPDGLELEKYFLSCHYVNQDYAVDDA